MDFPDVAAADPTLFDTTIDIVERPLTDSLTAYPVMVRSGDSHITRWVKDLTDDAPQNRVRAEEFVFAGRRRYGADRNVKCRSIGLSDLVDALADLDETQRNLDIPRLLAKCDVRGATALRWVLGLYSPNGADDVNDAGQSRVLSGLAADIAGRSGAHAAAEWVRSWAEPLPGPDHKLYTAMPNEVRDALLGVPADDPWSGTWHRPEVITAFRDLGLTPDQLSAWDVLRKWTTDVDDYAASVRFCIDREWTTGRVTRFASQSRTDSQPRRGDRHRGTDLLPRLEAFAALLDYGEKVTDATTWVSAGISGPDAPAVRDRWTDCGFDPDTARPWAVRGFTPQEAAAWAATGLDARIAQPYAQHTAVSPQVGALAHRLEVGYRDIQRLFVAESMHDERAVRIVDALRATLRDVAVGDELAAMFAELHRSGDDIDAIRAVAALTSPSTRDGLADAFGLGLITAA